MSESQVRNIKFRYIRDKRQRPRGVVAVDTNTGQVGWSFYHKKEETKPFSKAMAREIAVQRMVSGSGPNVTVPRDIQVEIDDVKNWLANK